MDLDRELIAGIEDLDQKWKTFALKILTEKFGPTLGPEIVKRFAGVGAGLNDGLFVFAVADFPGLAIGLIVGEVAMIAFFEGTPAPDAGHVERLKNNRFHGRKMLEGRETLKTRVKRR
jgi:hypothetical protein